MIQCVLLAKTHVDALCLAQVTTFSGPTRNLRTWSASNLYYTLLSHDRGSATAIISDSTLGSSLWGKAFQNMTCHAFGQLFLAKEDRADSLIAQQK